MGRDQRGHGDSVNLVNFTTLYTSNNATSIKKPRTKRSIAQEVEHTQKANILGEKKFESSFGVDF